MSGGGESEYQRCLHEADKCGWHCPYCKEEENDDEDELEIYIPVGQGGPRIITSAPIERVRG